jgi:hypothetical protein
MKNLGKKKKKFVSGDSTNPKIFCHLTGVDTNSKVIVVHRATKFQFSLALPINLLSGKRLLNELHSKQKRG